MRTPVGGVLSIILHFPKREANCELQWQAVSDSACSPVECIVEQVYVLQIIQDCNTKHMQNFNNYKTHTALKL